MLYVKIMSGQDLPDTDPWKHYTIVPVQNNEVMQFVDNPLYGPAKDGDPEVCRFFMHVHGPEGGHETHDLSGNAYVMTESGKTIASHGS